MGIRTFLTTAFFFGIATLAAGQAASPVPPPKASTASPSDLSPAASAEMTKRVEAYLRKVYAWGPNFQVKIGPITQSAGGALYTLPVEVSMNGQSDTAIVYVTKDGGYLIRGDIQNLNANPLESMRNQLHTDGYAFKGPADAKVVLVEFGDFECPSCRQLDTLLRQMLPQYPQVKLVFKDFPLEQVHPWAMTAAIAGHCVLQKSEDAFWKFHDSVYDSQDLISPENAYSKLTDLASSAGADQDAFKACMADPETKNTVQKSIDEGRSLQINSTPTTFVDGRTVVGPDEATLEQFINYDLPQN
jgi:protein-disulfide isomerase